MPLRRSSLCRGWGGGLHRRQGRSGNYLSLGWEFADCFYIWEIPGDHEDKDLENVVHNSNTLHWPDT